MLYPALGRNRWCGPAALAIISGKTTDETAAILRDVSGKRAIMRVRSRYMIQAIRRLGLEPWFATTGHLYRGKRQNLQQTIEVLRKREALSRPGVWVVTITGHYVVLEIRPGEEPELADNRTVYPVPWQRYRRLTKIVHEMWQITPDTTGTK
jgi:hypothetical protein